MILPLSIMFYWKELNVPKNRSDALMSHCIQMLNVCFYSNYEIVTNT